MVTNCFLASVPMLTMFALVTLLLLINRETEARAAAMIGLASGAWTHLGIGLAYSSDHVIFWWMLTFSIVCVLIILILRTADNYLRGGGK